MSSASQSRSISPFASSSSLSSHEKRAIEKMDSALSFVEVTRKHKAGDKESAGIEWQARLADNSNVVIAINPFKGKTYLNIREYFRSGNDFLPTKKGVMLTWDEWQDLTAASAAVLKLMEGHNDDKEVEVYQMGGVCASVVQFGSKFRLMKTTHRKADYGSEHTTAICMNVKEFHKLVVESHNIIEAQMKKAGECADD